MDTIRGDFDEDLIDRYLHNAFEKAKDQFMSDEKLKSYFVALCKIHSPKDAIISEKVYDLFLRKAIHARLAVVFRPWRESNVKKHSQAAFRTKLRAQNTS